MLPGARASSSGDRRRLDRTSCPGPSMMMPNGFARSRLPRETDHSARTEPACAGKAWCITHPIGQRCTDDQPTIKGRTQSKVIRERTWSWFNDDFLTRFAYHNGALLIVMTRRHVDDLLGHYQPGRDR